MNSRIICVWATTIAGFSFLAGCGNSLATVTGNVTFEGQPLAKGQIQFTPATGAPEGAPIVAGKYSAKLPPGEMTVLITETLEIQQATSTEELQKQAEAGIRPPPPPQPKVTATTPGNNKPVTIKPGSQTIDFPLGQ